MLRCMIRGYSRIEGSEKVALSEIFDEREVSLGDALAIVSTMFITRNDGIGVGIERLRPNELALSHGYYVASWKPQHPEKFPAYGFYDYWYSFTRVPTEETVADISDFIQLYDMISVHAWALLGHRHVVIAPEAERHLIRRYIRELNEKAEEREASCGAER